MKSGMEPQSTRWNQQFESWIAFGEVQMDGGTLREWDDMDSPLKLTSLLVVGQHRSVGGRMELTGVQVRGKRIMEFYESPKGAFSGKHIFVTSFSNVLHFASLVGILV